MVTHRNVFVIFFAVLFSITTTLAAENVRVVEKTGGVRIEIKHDANGKVLEIKTIRKTVDEAGNEVTQVVVQAPEADQELAVEDVAQAIETSTVSATAEIVEIAATVATATSVEVAEIRTATVSTDADTGKASVTVTAQTFDDTGSSTTTSTTVEVDTDDAGKVDAVAEAIAETIVEAAAGSDVTAEVTTEVETNFDDITETSDVTTKTEEAPQEIVTANNAGGDGDDGGDGDGDSDGDGTAKNNESGDGDGDKTAGDGDGEGEPSVAAEPTTPVVPDTEPQDEPNDIPDDVLETVELTITTLFDDMPKNPDNNPVAIANPGITGSPGTTVAAHSNVTLVAPENVDGKTFWHWLENGARVSTDNAHTFILDIDTTIEAIYSPALQ